MYDFPRGGEYLHRLVCPSIFSGFRHSAYSCKIQHAGTNDHLSPIFFI